MRWFYRAIGRGAWPVMRSHVSWCTKAMRVSLLRQNNGRSNTTWFSWRRWWRSEVWNNGCFVHLGRCGIVIWRLIAHYYYYWGGTTGVRPPAVLHCYLVLDTSTRLLYVPHVSDRKYRIHESEHRRRSTRHSLGFCYFTRSIDTNSDWKKVRAGLFPRGRQGSLA